MTAVSSDIVLEDRIDDKRDELEYFDKPEMVECRVSGLIFDELSQDSEGEYQMV